jgi:TPR repeat protein
MMRNKTNERVIAEFAKQISAISNFKIADISIRNSAMTALIILGLVTQTYAQNPFPMRDIRQSAESSQAAVSLNLALSMIEGRGVAKNIDDAKDILNDIVKTKSSAHPQSVDGRIVSVAYVTLAKLHMQADPKKAQELLHHSAVYYGNVEGQYLLGKQASDARVAIRWWTLAANKGYQSAMVDLGRLLFTQNNQAQGLMYLMMTSENEDKEAVLRDKFPDIYDKSLKEDRESAINLVNARAKK